MPRPLPRLHRLPQRLDYTLIPAPLDLSLVSLTEKSPLPAIIVTPSSPSSTHDFSIAFLAPPPKPPLRERLSSYTSFNAPWKIRSTIIFFVILFIMMCHLIAHRFNIHRPRLEFSAQTGEARFVDPPFDWFKLRSLFGSNPAPSDGALSQSDAVTL